MAKVLTIWRKITYRDVFVYVCDIVIKLERKLQDAKVLTAKLVARSTVWIVQLYVTLSRRCLTSFQALTQLQKDIVSKTLSRLYEEKKVLHKSFAKHFRFLQPSLKEKFLVLGWMNQKPCILCALRVFYTVQKWLSYLRIRNQTN